MYHIRIFIPSVFGICFVGIGRTLLFTSDYKENIEATLETFKKRQAFLNTDFRLIQISTESSIPMSYLTYFFNDILNTSFSDFSDWRNSLRVEYAMNLISQGEANTFTL
jgi:AraC-like DNA-binding protein